MSIRSVKKGRYLLALALLVAVPGVTSTRAADEQGSGLVDVNDAGVFLGHVYTGTLRWMPFTWHDGEVTQITPVPDGDRGHVAAINNPGEVVGSWWNVDTTSWSAFLWRDGGGLVGHAVGEEGG